MKFRIENSTLKELIKTSKRKIFIYFIIPFILICYLLFFLDTILPGFDLIYKIIFAMFLLFLGLVISKYQIKQNRKGFESFYIERTENSISKFIGQKTIDKIEISEIESVDQVKNGIELKMKSRRKKFFIPKIIEGFEGLLDELNKTVTNSKYSK